MKTENKRMTKLVVVLLVVTVIVVGMIFAVTELHLNSVQIEALTELEQLNGQYDNTHIVLSDCTLDEADMIAEDIGAKVRATSDGSFIVLYLKDVTIDEIYANREYRKYLNKFSPDGYVNSASENVPETADGHYAERPDFSVNDTYYDRQIYLNYINVGDTFSNATGTGVKIAVIDSGIDTDHPDFEGKISARSYNATDDKRVCDFDMSVIEDTNGHGTAIAGVISASVNNGEGVIGISPEAELIVIKVGMTNDGMVVFSDLVFGMYYAIECDVDIINMSWGGYGDIFASLCDLAYDSDIICVAGAGNDSTSKLFYPASSENVIGVGALRENSWELADYSNYGDNVDIVAPGTVYTTTNDGGYGYVSGTSVAAPCVTGAVALYLQNNKYARFEEVKEMLQISSADIGDLGHDWYFGYGVLDIHALVREEVGTITFDYLTDEMDPTTQKFIRNHTLQNIPIPERNYVVLDDWFYDPEMTEPLNWYSDVFVDDITLYANWINEEDGIPYQYVVLDDGTVEIRNYSGKRRFLTIPSIIDGKPVSSIGSGCFEGNLRLREITLSDTLVHIKDNAFKQNRYLTNIRIPNSVTDIGKGAFSECLRLSSIVIEDQSALVSIGDEAFKSTSISSFRITNNLKDINGNAFYSNTGMKSITVSSANAFYKVENNVLYNSDFSRVIYRPAGLTDSVVINNSAKVIEKNAFAYTNSESVTLNEGLEIIGSGAFEFGRIGAVAIPSSVTEIGEKAFRYTMISSLTFGEDSAITEINKQVFAGCSYLTEFNIPSSVKILGESAFSSCGFEGELIIPKNIEVLGSNALSGAGNVSKLSFESGSALSKIGDSVFGGYGKIENVVLPDSVRHLGEGVFAYCDNLTELILNDGLETIGGNLIVNTKIESISIPSTVRSIAPCAFAVCYELSEINVASGNQFYSSQNGVLFTENNSVLHSYPAGKDGSYTVPDSVKKIGDSAFAGVEKLTEITLPDGLLVIGNSAFNSCTSLQKIEFNESLEELGTGCFAYCSDLSSIVITKNVSMIGYECFRGDMNLKSITFEPDGALSRIGARTFVDCGITTITIPENVKSIGTYAFSGCQALVTVTFEGNSELTALTAYSFSGADKLRQITFESGSKLQTVEAHAFENMPSLERVTFEYCSQLKNIDNFAFRYCPSLTELYLPDGLETIGRYAFHGCSRLTKLDIPDTVEHIGSYAFAVTDNIELYFKAQTLPQYIEDDWDYGVKAYYLDHAKTVTSGGWKYSLSSSNTVTIISYSGNASELNIDTIDGYPVVSIGAHAFENNTELTCVTLPVSLTSIQKSAFAGTVSLSSIVIPEEVTFIGERVFERSGIREITFSGESKLTYLGRYAFANTNNLNSIAIPSGIDVIRPYTFYFSGIESISFDGTKLTEIGKYAFAYSKLKVIDIPESVISIGVDSFTFCANLTSVDLETQGNLMIGANAFYASGLTSVTIPENVRNIAEFCFSNCAYLTEINVDVKNSNYSSVNGVLYNKDCTKLITCPGGKTGSFVVDEKVATLAFGAFEGTKLTNVMIPQNSKLMSIGYRAFYDAKNLESITIPDDVLSIGYYAFANCENLETVQLSENSSLNVIGEGAFYNCEKLTTFDIPAGVQEISDYAFYGCVSITEFSVSPECELKGINAYALAFTGITELDLKDSLYMLGDFALAYTDLTEVNVPECCEEIGLGAFYHCDYLEKLTIPSLDSLVDYVDEDNRVITVYYPFSYFFSPSKNDCSWDYIPANFSWEDFMILSGDITKDAFRNCQSITSITIPSDAKEIGEYAFYNCDYLEVINMSDSVEVFGEHAFAECGEYTSLKIDFPKNLKSIGPSALWNAHFRGNDYYYIPASVESIYYSGLECANAGRYMFFEADTLPEIRTEYQWYPLTYENREQPDYIRLGVKQICENDEFRYYVDSNGKAHIMDYLGNGTSTDMSIEGYEVVEICSNAFEDNHSLTEIVIPDTVTSIGQYAFHSTDGITELVIPESVTYIGQYAFAGCPAEITLFGYSEILRGTFINTSMLKIVVPKGVKTIAEYCFGDARYLEEIVLPDTVECLKAQSFNPGPFNELRSLNIPASVTMIEEGAFVNCEKLVITLEMDEIPSTFPENWNYDSTNNKFIPYRFASDVEYEDNGFKYTIDENGKGHITGYTGTGGEIVISAGEYEIVEIAVSAFNGNSTVTSVTIPEGVKTISSKAFENCTALVNVTFPSTLETIEENAFKGCYRLAEADLPDSVTSLGVSCFEGCSNMHGLHLPADITVIPDHAFSDTAIWDLVIPSKVETIGHYAFSSVHGLSVVILPSSVKTVGDCAFGNSFTLKAVYVPETVTAVGAEAFRGTTALYAASDIPAYSSNYPNMTEWVYSVNFQNATNIFNASEVMFHSGYTFVLNEEGNATIIDYTGSDSILDFDIGGYKVVEIGCKAFKNSSYIGAENNTIKEVILPDTVEIIRSEAFSACTALEKVILPNRLKIIGKNAFSRSKLKEIVIPDTVETIESNAFSQSNLKNIDLGHGVRSIGSNAFQYTQLQYLYVPESVIDYSCYETNLSFTMFEADSLPLANDVPLEYGWSSNYYLGVKEVLENEDFKYFLDGDGNAYILKYIGDDTIVDVAIENHSVVDICSGAFRENTDISKVVLHEGLKKINSLAFYNCTSLVEAKLPDSLEFVGNSAFYCTRLGTVVVPEKVQYIGMSAFAGTYSYYENGSWTQALGITEITVKGCPGYIGENEWQLFCENGVSVTFTSLSGPIEGWKGTHDSFVYTGEKGYEQEYYSPGLTFENNGAYYSVSGYTGTDAQIIIPSEYQGLDVRVVENSAFENKSTVKAVVIPDTVVEIGKSAFSRCTELKNISISDNVKRIMDSAFSGCISLEEFYIPDSVTYLGIGVFSYCDSLKSVRISENIKVLNQSMFSNCTSLADVELPDSMTTIKRDAFSRCSALKSINLPSNLTEIGANAFGYCTSLESITIPGGVTVIPEWAFEYCTSLKSVTMNEGITTIEKNAFTNNTSLEKVIMPGTLKTIGSSVFFRMAHLVSLYIPKSVESIGDEAISWIGNGHNAVIAFESEEVPASFTERLAGEYCLGVKEYSNEGIYYDYFILSDGTCTVVLKETDRDHVYVPDTINGHPVTKVDTSLCRSTVLRIPVTTGISSDIVIPKSIEKLVLGDNCTKNPKPNNATYLVYTNQNAESSLWSGDYNEDEWHEAFFYDKDGELCDYYPYLIGEVIHQPSNAEMTALAGEDYEFVGWDLNGDGNPDNLPAKLSDDLHAYAIYNGPVSSIVVSCDDLLELGESTIATVSYYPENATGDTALTWKSTDESVVTVDSSGNITAVGYGTVMVKAELNSNPDVYDEVKITVYSLISGLEITGSDTVNVGETRKYSVNYDENASVTADMFEWTVSDESIATVAANGSVTAVAPGTVTVTATLGKYSASKTVTVYAPLKGILVNTSYGNMRIDRTKQMEVLYSPRDTTDDKTVMWSTSDPTVATVSETGLVTAIKAGTAIITAKVGNFTDTYTVTVVGVKDIDSGFIITNNDDTSMDDGIEAVVLELGIDDPHLVEAVGKIKVNLTPYFNDITALVYDICLQLNNVTVQPGKTVDVEIKLPSGMMDEKIFVYRIEDDNTITDMQAEVKNGWLKFKTDHFSVYAVCTDKEEMPEKAYTFKGATVSMAEYLYANYYVQIDDPEELDNLAVRFTFNGKNTIVPGSEAVEGSAKVNDGKTYYYFSFGVPAKAMVDNIRAELISADGELVYDTKESYSIQTYYMNMLNKDTSSQKMKDVSVAALNYGARIQEYFEYKTTNLANAGLTDAQKSLSAAPVQPDESWNVLSLSGSINNLKVAGASLLFEADTKIHIYFTLKDAVGNEITDNFGDLEVCCDNSALVPEYSEDRGYWFVSVEGIAATDLGDKKTVVFTADTQTVTVEYSPMTYIYRKYNSTSPGLSDAVKAMYLYYSAALYYATH